MLDVQKIVAYIVLFASAFLLWNLWSAEHAPKPHPTTTVQTTATATASEGTNHHPNIPSITAAPTKEATSTPTSLARGNLITVKTDVLNVSIDSVGGNLVQSGLRDYAQTLQDPNEPYTLLNDKSDDTYLAESGLIGKDGEHDQHVYDASKRHYTLEEGKDSLTVNLTWNDARGLHVEKSYTFYRGQYKVDLSYSVTNKSANTWNGHYYLQLVRSNTPPPSSSFIHYTYFGAAISSPEKHYQKVSFKDMGKQPLNKTIQGGWAAMIQHYFVSSWVPTNTEAFRYYSNKNDNLYTIGMVSPDLTVASGETKKVNATLYTGPAIGTNLNAVAPNLKLTIDYGWFWFISVILFWCMQHIHDVVGNWGWSIVLVTVMIRLVFYKLSAKSYRSMAEMKKLQPRIKILQDRYKDDKQTLSQKTMELYRKEKVNPLGGCLPLLIQIPVFIGLYWVIIESVQLRQAPFILWIHDLSMKDPYYVLPIIMGITMFLQQKISPPPPDPVQAKVMLALPIVFTFMFLNFPAGLVIYWIVNNSISISQQWYMMRKFGPKKHS